MGPSKSIMRRRRCPQAALISGVRDTDTSDDVGQAFQAPPTSCALYARQLGPIARLRLQRCSAPSIKPCFIASKKKKEGGREREREREGERERERERESEREREQVKGGLHPQPQTPGKQASKQDKERARQRKREQERGREDPVLDVPYAKQASKRASE